MSAKQTAIDARLTVLLPQVIVLQESYLANSGRYFQGLASHGTMPDGETPTLVDLTVHPNDQTHTYADFWRRVHWVDVWGEETFTNSYGVEETHDVVIGREEQHQFSEADLDDVKMLTVRTRFDVQCGVEGWSWKLTLDYEDATGHNRKVVNKDGTVEDWHIIEQELDNI
jgi:hypothetical protein